MTAVALDRPRAVAERAPFLEGLFLATVFSVTFAKLQWEVAGTLSLSDVVTGLFLLAFLVYRVERFDGRLERAAVIALAFFVAFLLVYLIGWFNLETAQSLAQWAKGMVKFLLHFLFLVAGISLIARRGVQFYWLTLGAFVGGVAANAAYGVAQLAVAEGTGRNLDAGWLQPLTGGASKINIYGAIEGQNVFRINALTGDPNHLGIELAAVLVLMLPIYLRLERGHRCRDAARRAARLPVRRRARDALAQRDARARLRVPRAADPVPAALPDGRGSSCRSGSSWRGSSSSSRARSASSSRCSPRASRRRAAARRRTSSSTTSSPTCSRSTRCSGSGSTRSPSTTSSRPGRRTSGRTRSTSPRSSRPGLVGTLVFAAFLVYLFRRAGATRRIGRALAAIGDPLAARVWPLGWGLTAALVSTMASNVFYLTMSFYYFYVIALLAIARAGRVRAAPRRDVKVVVLTTSYPRDADDVAGTFVRDGVEALRAAGVEVRVVSPASFRHYGIAYGDGIVNNLRAAPWKALALPLFLLAFARAARRAARDADVVHAHWLPSALPALATRKPFVLQLWGSDVALARRVPTARAVARPARASRGLRVDGARRRRTRARRAATCA